jgi:hypothetical protein
MEEGIMEAYTPRLRGGAFARLLLGLFLGLMVFADAAFALTVSPTSVQMVVGGSATVAVSKRDGSVSVRSADTDIATVSYENGVATIKGRSVGSTTVTIRDSEDRKRVSVTVTAPSLTVSPASLSVAAGSAATISVTNASGSVTASSSNKSVATVSYASGVATVRGVAAGTATIRISDSRTSKQVTVTVTAASASLTVSPTSVSVAAGSTATVSVSNASGTVTASSSNTSIATLTYASGTVTVRGVAAGTATITIADSKTSKQVAVTVTAAAASLTVSPTTLGVVAGSTATVSVSNASGTVTATSSNTSVATVTYASGAATVRGVAAGTATITIADSKTSKQVAVTVTAASASLTVSPTSVSVAAGSTATVSVSNASGTVTASSSNTSIATVTYASGIATVRGVAAGTATITIADSKTSKQVAVTVTASTGSQSFAVLAANDLGMHCADLDYQIFSILPPFNVIHAQVIQKGSKPVIVDGNTVDVYYSAASSALDPAGANSVNSFSVGSVYKSNFWELASRNQSYGTEAYRRLYPSVTPLVSALDAYAPLADNVGLPVPDPNAFPSLVIAQQGMPVTGPQKFDRFDANLAFFTNFPFGANITGTNWFSADGIPILPKDDQGRLNAYPLMRIGAVTKGAAATSTPLAKVDVVVPVASEADCQNCHAAASDYGSGRAADFATTSKYASGVPWSIETSASAPGPETLQNAAKINILRLHDAKHGSKYVSSATGAATPCVNGNEASCLDARRAIQCAQCHYTPALDLLHTGPVDDKGMGEEGRQQTRHISMSRAMHGNHGKYSDIFPDMPAPGSRTPDQVSQVLQDTCYSCHPGKTTKCLRGAMATGGVVCQDCHGQMRQVGNDFSANLPTTGQVDLTRRVPWANEPKCQSCHVGDAVSVATMNRTNMIVASDGIRLLQTYLKSDAAKDILPMIQASTSRFAENASLYRLSKGHGGVMCKGCHGATHAEWPNANPNANDNVAAVQLQGHSGVIAECTTCHTTMPANGLNGPHGLHPVNSTSFVSGHKSLAKANPGACRSCHGTTGTGTVLSRTFADRTFSVEGKTVKLPKGTQVRCDTCHGQKL